MAKKKEVLENELVENETVVLEDTTQEDNVALVEEAVPTTPVVKKEEEAKQQVVIEEIKKFEVVVDEPVVTAKNIVEDITLKTEFEVGDSVKIDDKPYKVVKVKITKSYDLEDQFGKVERNVYAHLIKDNSVDFASFVAKANS